MCGKMNPLSWDEIRQFYLFKFESIMLNPTARKIFENYLEKEEYNLEPLLFLTSVESFKESVIGEKSFSNINSKEGIKDLVSFLNNISETIDAIRKTFLIKDSAKELNLPFDLRNRCFTFVDSTLEAIGTAIDTLSDISVNAEDPSSLTISLTDLKTNIFHVFSSVELYIWYQLKNDNFPRFVRSDIWKKYIKRQKKELIQDLAQDSKSNLERITSLTKADMVDPIISEKLVDYIKMQVCQDSNHWILGYTGFNGNCTFYHTTQSFFAGDIRTLKTELRNMVLSKCVYYFNATVNEVALLCVGKETHFDLDPNATSTNQVEYLSTTAARPYAIQICSHFMQIGPLFKKRFSLFSWTMLYDKSDDQIIIIAKTCDHEKMPLPSNHVQSYFILGFVIKKISDSVTRLVAFQQLNTGGIFKSSFFSPLSTLLLQKRAIAKYKHYSESLIKNHSIAEDQSGTSSLERTVTTTYGIFDTFKENIKKYNSNIDTHLLDLKHTNFSMKEIEKK